MASNTRTRLRAILARALNSLVWLFPRHGACEHSVHLTIVSHSNSAPGLRLPGLLHCPEGFRPLTATPECSGASRQTPASVEYLRRHAGLGQDSNPAKQSRIQLHVAIDAARVNAKYGGTPKDFSGSYSHPLSVMTPTRHNRRRTGNTRRLTSWPSARSFRP